MIQQHSPLCPFENHFRINRETSGTHMHTQLRNCRPRADRRVVLAHTMDIIINSYSKMSYQGVERQRAGGGVLSAAGILQEKMAISEF